MKTFLLYAHPEPKSFNAALRDTAAQTLESLGHEVRVSDLYAMDWNPVSGRHNFTTVLDPDYYKQQAEEAHATEHGGFAADVEAELQKLEWCQLFIVQFPLWWFGLPAILKGWFDRVLAYDRTYGNGRFYEGGVFHGRRAFCCLTTGAAADAYEHGGFNGPILTALKPIHRGILYFVGFTVLPPYIAYAPAHVSDADRQEMLREYERRLRQLDTAPPLHDLAL